MNAEMLLDLIVSEADKFFASYPRGLVYSQFKTCTVPT